MKVRQYQNNHHTQYKSRIIRGSSTAEYLKTQNRVAWAEPVKKRISGTAVLGDVLDQVEGSHCIESDTKIN